MTPTLCRTLGVKGHRPVVGTLDGKDKVYAFASMNVITGKLTTRLLTRTAQRKKPGVPSHQKKMQVAFCQHLKEVARAYPANLYPRVILQIDNAPWHQGKSVTDTLLKYPHLSFYRLPSYSPALSPIERLWKILRRRATHNRLFLTLRELRHALRGSLCYYQTLKHRILSLIGTLKLWT